MDTLDSVGLSDTTNVVYTSDHGDMLGKFGMWSKCRLYEDSVRIPNLCEFGHAILCIETICGKLDP